MITIGALTATAIAGTVKYKSLRRSLRRVRLFKFESALGTVVPPKNYVNFTEETFPAGCNHFRFVVKGTLYCGPMDSW